MHKPIECRGTPRAMGLCQGESCRESVRARVAHSGVAGNESLWPGLKPLTSGRLLGRGPGRDIIRHYPHLSERIEGLARGAGLPFATLMELFLRATTSAGAPGGALAAEAAVILAPGGHREGIVVARVLPGSDLPGSAWIVRQSRPEVGFASLEVTLPWLASAVAGVNDRGLAVAIAPGEPDLQAAGSEPSTVLCLVQDCLQRFADIRGCADWCSKRPASGRAAIVVAEASGRALSVEIAGSERRIVRAEGRLSLAGGSQALRSQLRDELAGAEDGIKGLVRCHAARIEESRGPTGALVALEPGSGRLKIHPLAAGGSEAAMHFELPVSG